MQHLRTSFDVTNMMLLSSLHHSTNKQDCSASEKRDFPPDPKPVVSGVGSVVARLPINLKFSGSISIQVKSLNKAQRNQEIFQCHS